MDILHILTDGPDPLIEEVRAVQSADHRIEVIDLTRDNTSYDAIVDRIFASDWVISW